MSLLQRSMILVTAVFCLSAVFAVSAAVELDANCLGCMCEAATRCNATTACHHSGGGYFCGAFHISWAYWADAKKPVLQHDNPDRQGAFEACATDLYCAADVVKQYMKTFAQDCDGDGVVTCKDYVRLHKLGRLGCTAPLRQDRFLAQFEECATRLNVY